MVSENKDIDTGKVARNIAADINKLDKTASKEGRLKDLKSIDFTPLLNGSIAKTLNETAGRLKKMAEEASKKNKLEIEEISGQIESSLKERQVRLTSGLKELGKTDIKNESEVKIVLNRISTNADLSNRRLNEIQIDKTIRERKI